MHTTKFFIAILALGFITTGCLAPTRSVITEYREDGTVLKVTESSESVVASVTQSTKGKTVIAWESGWMAYMSLSTATTEDPTPTIKMFAGKSDKGVISALPNQAGWDGIAKTVLSTKQDLRVSADGFTNTSSTSPAASTGAEQ